MRSAATLSRFRAKWIPVGVKKTRGHARAGAWRATARPEVSAQRLFQQRKTVGIEAHRWLQHRRFHRARGRPLVDAGIVGNVAVRGGSAPALENGADEMHVVA